MKYTELQEKVGFWQISNLRGKKSHTTPKQLSTTIDDVVLISATAATRCQFHQPFTCKIVVQIFCQSQNVTRKAAQKRLLYEKFGRIMLMKLMPDIDENITLKVYRKGQIIFDRGSTKARGLKAFISVSINSYTKSFYHVINIDKNCCKISFFN
jgi:hypothetical protein